MSSQLLDVEDLESVAAKSFRIVTKEKYEKCS